MGTLYIIVVHNCECLSLISRYGQLLGNDDDVMIPLGLATCRKYSDFNGAAVFSCFGRGKD